MTLSEFAATHKRRICDELLSGQAPSIGVYDAELFKEAKARSKAPQMGETRFTPDSVILEYIYSDPLSSAIVFTVTLGAPERIVYLPVPKWVVENIWQGDVAGSYHFESDARRLLEELSAQCSPEGNHAVFGGSAPKIKG